MCRLSGSSSSCWSSLQSIGERLLKMKAMLKYRTEYCWQVCPCEYCQQTSLQKLSQSPQIIPCPTVKSSLFPVSDTFLHELSAVEGHASGYFRDGWYTNPLDLLSLCQPKTFHLPFHPTSCLCLLPKMSSHKLCSMERTDCYQFRSATPTHCYQKTVLLEKPFHVITFLQQKEMTIWFQDDSGCNWFCVFSCALNNSYFS